MQSTRRGYIARRIPCRFSSCGRWFKSAAGLKTHLHSFHRYDSNVSDDTEQPLPPDVVREYHEKLNGLSSSLIFTVIKSHSTGKICDANGMDLPEGTPPFPHTPHGQDDWTLYRNRLKFETAKHFFSKAQASAGEIDNILHLWGLSLAPHGDDPPFADHQDLYKTINSTPIGDAPWKSFRVKYTGNRPPEDPPSWMNQTYDVWYRDPRAIIKNILSNTDFNGEINYAPHRDFMEDGSRRYKNFMSGDWAWEQVVSNITLAIGVVAVNITLYRMKLPKILNQMGQPLSPLSLAATKPPSPSPQARMSTGWCTFPLGMFRTTSAEHTRTLSCSSDFYLFQKVCKLFLLLMSLLTR